MRAFCSALFSKIVRWSRPDGVRATQTPLVVTCEPVPAEAIALIAGTLKEFGASVSRRSVNGVTFGRVTSHAGVLNYRHQGQTLIVTLIEDLGHFPRAMVIGGIKQTVYEAVELHNIQRGATPGRRETKERSIV